MADLSQTAANVAIGGTATTFKKVQFGEAVTQGNLVYKSTSDSKYYKADANDTLAKALVGGIVLTPAATNGEGLIATPSNVEGTSLVNVGATLTLGVMYAASATAGGICPITDITSGQYPTGIGFPSTTSLLDFKVTASPVAKA